MKYYLGKGTEFKKEECNEYKTKDGVLKALEKTEDGVVWDENGQFVCSVVDVADVPEGALETNPDGSVPAFDADGNSAGMVDADVVAAVAGEERGEETEQGDAEEEQDEDVVIVPQGKMRVTVVCDGSLNLRRSPAWGNDNICGRAIRGQSYYVKEIHKVNGKKMVRTVGDIYMSGESEHVQFEQL